MLIERVGAIKHEAKRHGASNRLIVSARKPRPVQSSTEIISSKLAISRRGTRNAAKNAKATYMLAIS